MSNSSTLEELKKVLGVIKEDIKTIKTKSVIVEEERALSGIQLSEIHSIIMNLSVKFDMLLSDPDSFKNIHNNVNTSVNNSDVNIKTKKPIKRSVKNIIDEPIDGTDIKKPSKSTKQKNTNQRNPNKMEFFNKMYDNDNEYFSTYITEDVKKEILINNEEKWNKLSGEKLNKEKRTACYSYMKNNHDDALQSMKQAYIDDMNKSNIDIVTKEEMSD